MQAAIARPATLPARVGARRPSRSAVRVNALVVPDQYGYVMASVAATAALIQWQAIRVAVARKESGIKYPQMYADGTSEAAMKFNCTQRAHQNTLEYAPGVLGLQAMLGLVYPQVAAGLGAAWVAGRVLYTLGYSKGDPQGRLPGAAASGLVYLALLLSTLVVGVRTALP